MVLKFLHEIKEIKLIVTFPLDQDIMLITVYSACLNQKQNS